MCRWPSHAACRPQDLPTFVQVPEEEEQGEVLEDEFDLSDIMNESVEHESFPKARDEL